MGTCNDWKLERLRLDYCEIRSKIDKIWDSFWTGGVSNSLEVMEQITYFLFIKRLDDLHTLEENKASRIKKPMEQHTFPESNDPRKRPYEVSSLVAVQHFEPKEMFESFCVPKSDIVEQGYDRSINRYKKVILEEVDHRAPQAILDELESMKGMKELRRMQK